MFPSPLSFLANTFRVGPPTKAAPCGLFFFLAIIFGRALSSLFFPRRLSVIILSFVLLNKKRP